MQAGKVAGGGAVAGEGYTMLTLQALLLHLNIYLEGAYFL